MAKFRVGDRVMMKLNTGRITRIAWNEFGYKSAEPAVVAAVDNGDVYFKYRVLLDNKSPTDYGYWWAAESELSPLAPAVPDGWTPASAPPDSDRNVRVIMNDGRVWYAWYGDLKDLWHIYKSDASIKLITENPRVYYYNYRDAAPGEVIAWREIEPEPAAQVRYAVAAELPTNVTVWHDSYDAAVAEAQRLCVKCGKTFRVLKVVAEVKPAEPEVIRMEE